MQLTSTSFEDGGPIPATYAFAKADPQTHATFAGNRSPQLSWSGLPAGSASLVLVCVDPDAPSVADDVNQEGRSVPHDLPRADFHHWVMVDIPASCPGLDEGACSDGVTPGGKPHCRGPQGSRQGLNDYTSWFAGDADMAGTYQGYDGPAPPWNDERVHRYHFELHALDVARLDVPDGFDVPAVRAAMAGHVLASATLTGSYTQNPALLG